MKKYKEGNRLVVVGSDGVKGGLSLTDYASWEEVLLGYMASDGASKLVKSVPWLHRGYTLRKQAMGRMPFEIVKGEDVIDSSADYQNRLKWLPDPSRLFNLLEGSLVLSGSFYIFRGQNRQGDKYWQYLIPSSVEPVINDSGVVGFKRNNKEFTKNDIIYGWDTDNDVELGPPGHSPATAALAAAGVLNALDVWSERHVKAGLIKKTVFSIASNTPETERLRFREWLRRTFGGGAKTGGGDEIEVLNADAANATVIGEGFADMANVDLTTKRREDIATALGVPQSKLFSNAATYATKVGDDKSFLEDTIIPDAEFIEQTLNDQAFMDMGLRFHFLPDQLPAFQKDESERATTFATFAAHMPPDLAGQMAGLDLPSEMTWEQFAAACAAKAPEESPEVSPMEIDLAKWHRKSVERLKKTRQTKRGAVEFESKNIDPVLSGAIRGQLEEATTEQDVERIFKQAKEWANYP